MKVVRRFEFDDGDLEAIATYRRERFGDRSVSKLANRKMVDQFIDEAVGNQWMAVQDVLSGLDGKSDQDDD